LWALQFTAARFEGIADSYSRAKSGA